MNMPPCSAKPLAYQKGAVILYTVVVLAFIMGLMALTVSRPSLNEQRITGNDIRAKEAKEAAEAGMAFAVAWLSDNSLSTDMNCPGGGGCPSLPSISDSTSGSTYSLAIEYDLDGAGNIEITSSATGSDNSNATIQSWHKQLSILNDPMFPPPLVINGDFIGPKGGPDILTGDPPNTAIIANAGSTIDADRKHLNKNEPLGAIIEDTFPGTSTPAWDYVFSVSLAQAISKAKADGYVESGYSRSKIFQPAAGKGPYYYYDSSQNLNGGPTLGTADNPVILIIEGFGGCPKINGGTTIYGVVYLTNGCSRNGWGGATVYGSVVSEGHIDKLNANTDLIDFNGGDEIDSGVFPGESTSIPGTWKDF